MDGARRAFDTAEYNASILRLLLRRPESGERQDEEEEAALAAAERLVPAHGGRR